MQSVEREGSNRNIEEAKEHLKKAKDKAGDAIHDYKEQAVHSARETTDELKAKVGDYSSQMVDCIKKNPLMSVGIAAFAGALLGMAMKP
jgi:ElaB/YqjD/DUF883 family membrane-anchored ribosome-binding protein